jgi:putative nucleotidyltransferase with HDIG domain
VDRDQAWALLCEHTQTEHLRKHGLAVEAVMRHLAPRYGGDLETWAVTGLLHDFDYERDPAGHPQNGRPILEQAGVPGEIVHAIQTHGDHLGLPRTTPLQKSLYAVDELSGFVIAVALVRPSKRVADVTPDAVRRKMKDKAFARAVSRDMLLAGAAGLGVELDDLVRDTVEALSAVADRLGLAGTAPV